MDEFSLSVLANMGLLSFLALSAYLLLIAGEMSFGQQAFFGIGAYCAGMATVLQAMPLAVALVLSSLIGAILAGGLGLLTLRLRGLYFSMSTLAAAEVVRIIFEIFHARVETAQGDWIGPNGAEGFGGIRYLYEHDLSAVQIVLLIYGVLISVLVVLFYFARNGFDVVLRMVGEDPELASMFGIRARRVKLAVTAAAGAIAALGGGLYAHYLTYVEPANFNVMLGVHSLSYALIGGLGTPLGPFLGVTADILLLEGSRIFRGYRMIVFGGMVAGFLAFRPRGLLDEQWVSHVKFAFRRMRRPRSAIKERI